MYKARASNHHSARTRNRFDPRWTPLLQNQGFDYFSLDNREKDKVSDKKLLFHYFNEQDFKLARINHTLEEAKNLNFDDDLLDVHVGDFPKYLHKQITEDMQKIEIENIKRKFADVKNMIDIRQKVPEDLPKPLQNDETGGKVHILYSQRQNSKRYESASDTLGESSLPSQM